MAFDSNLRLVFDNKPGGGECVIDTDCADNRCRRYPDGKKYCVTAGASCVYPGSDGTGVGKSVTIKGNCYRCAQGLGWQPCPSESRGTTGRTMPNSR